MNKLRILLAEDVEVNQLLAQKILDFWGAFVDIVDNGEEAVRKVIENEYDIVLMDIQMLVMDGLEATRQIRNLNSYKADIPVIALTASVIKGSQEKYFEAGMNDYLSKPFTEESLLAVVERVLKNRSFNAEYVVEIEVSNPEKRLYDLEKFRKLSRGDEVFVKKMIELFIKLGTESIGQLQESYAKSDWPEIARIAHKLKSSIDNLDIWELKTLIRELEQKAKLSSADAIKPDLDKVIHLLSKALEQLKQEL